MNRPSTEFPRVPQPKARAQSRPPKKSYAQPPHTNRRGPSKAKDPALLLRRRWGAGSRTAPVGLGRADERYSYELVRALGDADGLVTTEGTLYPLLGRLRREGVVDTTWRESLSGPPRRYYRLTSDGQAALGGFVTEWTRFRDSVDALLENGVLR
jgi:PadR family transcriptional regulator PadR